MFQLGDKLNVVFIYSTFLLFIFIRQLYILQMYKYYAKS